VLLPDTAKAAKKISWEEWVLRSPCCSDDETDPRRTPADDLVSRDPNQEDIDAFDGLFRDGFVVIDREHDDPERLRYLEDHVPCDVLTSMRQWHPQYSHAPQRVSEAGMLWLQRLLVDRETIRLCGFNPPGYGPRDLSGVVEALGVVCFHCGPTNGTIRYLAGNVFVIVYARALRRCYRDAGSKQSAATNC
jgi:hypothetical protein